MIRNKQLSVLVIAIVACLVVAGGVFGYSSWKNGGERQQSAADSETTSETRSEKNQLPGDATKEPVEEGTITGSLTYPSEGIPADLVIHAFNTETRQDFFVKDHLKDSRFKYGVGYKITVPAGKYHVYGVLGSQPDQRAYYDEFIKCGADTTKCEDLSRIVVTVEPGKESEDAIVGDWYNPCVVEGGEQPTDKFDLPTC
jgi:hypothetical protein